MDLFAKTCKICQQLKKRSTIYGHLPRNNISELKPWDTVNVDLPGPYSKYIRQQQPDSNLIQKNASLNCMMMIELSTGWFEIVEITTFDLEEVAIGNDEYIDKYLPGSASC